MGIAYERSVGFYKDAHAHDRPMLVMPRGSCVVKVRTGAWSLSNTEAGWISGIYYAAYTIVVPLLSSLTDRVDPKRVYLGSVALTAVAFARSARRTAGLPTGPSQPVGARLFDRVLRAHVGDVCAARLGRHISDVRGRPDLQRLDATGARDRRQRHGPRRRVGQRLGQRAVHSIRPPPFHPRDDAHLRGVGGGDRFQCSAAVRRRGRSRSPVRGADLVGLVVADSG